jgi:transposase
LASYCDRYLIEARLTDDCFVCPACGCILAVFGTYRRILTDIPRDGKHVYIYIAVPRRECESCNVGFVDSLRGLSSSHWMTQRTLEDREKKFRFRVPDVHIALDPGLSLRTIGRVRREWQEKMEAAWHPVCPRYMTIDEIYPEDKKKRKTTGKRKGYCVISDDELGRIIEFLPSLKKTKISQFFRSLPHPENLKAISMDLTNHLDEVVRSVFSEMPIVRDESHILREACEQFDRIRKLIGNVYMHEMTPEKYAEYLGLKKSDEFDGNEPKIKKARQNIRNSLNRRSTIVPPEGERNEMMLPDIYLRFS